MTRRPVAGALLLAALAGAPVPGRAQDAGGFEISFSVNAFDVQGQNPLPAAETRALLAPHLGEQSGLEGIEAASEALQHALRERGFAFHRVIVPPQKLTGGTVVLKVTSFSLSVVEVQGNAHFSEQNIRRSLPAVREGQAPNSRAIARAIQVANEHPAKRVAVFLKQSGEPGGMAARIRVRDARPWQLFASLANTGTQATGEERISVGWQHSNLFDRDHALTLSYTTSPGHYGDVKQRGVFYNAPLYPLSATVSAYYSRSSVSQGNIGGLLDVSGEGVFKGLRVRHALLARGPLSQSITLGIDDKVFQNQSTFTFLGAPVTATTDVRTRPLTLSYAARWEGEGPTGGFSLDYVRNIAAGRNNDSAAYLANRAGAEPSWDLWRASADLDHALSESWSLRSRVSGQYAAEALIPGEQFGLGGAGSIRGLEERESSGDAGFQLNVEIWGPVLGEGGLRPLGFVDLGHRYLRNTVPGQDAHESMAGAGLGLRWQIGSHLSLSADLARVMDGSQSTSTGSYKLHFSAFARF